MNGEHRRVHVHLCTTEHISVCSSSLPALRPKNDLRRKAKQRKQKEREAKRNKAKQRNAKRSRSKAEAKQGKQSKAKRSEVKQIKAKDSEAKQKQSRRKAKQSKAKQSKARRSKANRSKCMLLPHQLMRKRMQSLSVIGSITLAIVNPWLANLYRDPFRKGFV